MSIAVQRRRGTTVEHATFTGLEGEITIDTNKETAVVHNGATAGGFPLAREDLNNVSLATIAGKGIAKDNMTNVAQADVAALGIAKNDLSNLTGAADASETFKGVIELATQAEVNAGTDAVRAVTPATLKTALTATYGNLSRGAIDGLTLSNAADVDHDIAISAGEARNSTDVFDMSLASALTKQIDANWVAGDNLGGFPSSLTLSANTWYHVFLIAKTDGTVDAGFDTSLTATNLLADASAYTYYRRIGSVKTDGSSNIKAFTQSGDEFLWASFISDFSGTPTTTATLTTLSTPTGVKTWAFIAVHAITTASVNAYGLITSPDQVDVDPAPNASSGTPPLFNIGYSGTGPARSVESFFNTHIRTNTSSQIRHRFNSATSRFDITTMGWVDPRGKE